MTKKNQPCNSNEAVKKLENSIDQLLSGKVIKKQLDIENFPDDLKPLAEKILQLSCDFSELKTFSRELSNGNINVEIPDKKNLLCGEIKEIHSQYSSLCWSLEQFLQGNVVSKLYFPGELFGLYNDLISKVSKILSNEASTDSGLGSSVTSWRYHHILTAINQLNIMIIEVDENGKVLFINPPASNVIGKIEHLPYSESEITQPLVSYLCTFSGKVAESQEKNPLNPKFTDFHELYDPVDEIWYKITSNLITLVDGGFGILHAIDDISGWKKRESLLKQRADFDVLTSAYTRKAGMAILEEFLQKKRDSSCIAFCDIDGLKEINDLYGHTEGDYAIKTISEAFLHCVRDSDSVIRYGGDEFIILFPNCEESHITNIIHRMHNRLENVNNATDKPYKLSFSIGYSVIPNDFVDINQLIDSVDEKMYENKKNKKNKNR